MLPKFITKRKFIFVVVVLLLFSLLLAKPIQAFVTPNATYQFQFEQAIRSPEMNLQSFVYETLKATAGSIVTTLTGCLSCPPGERGFGMIGTMSTLIASIYASPPASGIAYLADIGKKLELIQPTYAQEQGVGFKRMIIFLDIWTAFRNIAYVFFILIFIFMGFAIMFRVKISPQAVITIQSALPRIIVVLILVTFSYAIVGFLIDLMFVISNLIIYTFLGVMGFPEFIQEFFQRKPFIYDLDILGMMMMIGWIPIIATFIIVIGILAIPSLILGAAGVTIPIVAGIDAIVLILVALVFLIALIRIFWTLLKAYAFVVINLIFAPFQILIGVLPGSNAIGSWFRNLLANLAVLPAVLTMVFLSSYIIIASVTKAIPNFWHELGEYFKGGVNIEAIMEMIMAVPTAIASILVLIAVSIVLLLLTPKVADMIQAFLAGKPFGYGAAIGEAMGPVTLAGRLGAAGGIGYAGGELTTTAYVAARPWLKKLIEETATAAQKRTLGR